MALGPSIRRDRDGGQVAPPRSEGSSPEGIETLDEPGSWTDPGYWIRRVDRLRVEERDLEVMSAFRAASRALPPADLAEVLPAITLAFLADVPEDQASRALSARIEGDPEDLDARVARIRRLLRDDAPAPADRPRVGHRAAPGPDAISELRRLLERSPGHRGAREVLVEALLDAGRVDEARAVLDGWPGGPDRERDPTFLRLRARFDLDHDGLPARAAQELRLVLAEAPHDWRLRARLARALAMAGDPDRAAEEAAWVDRLRERLDPERLGPRLADDLGRTDDPAALADLAEICRSALLPELALSWRAEARRRAARGSIVPDRAGSSRPSP
ncbi:tetratricopeptide repeat protein [Tautonia sociabilis]|nr:tetratricopeptide repeat protein [Tautonia sociabilis]